MTRRTSNPTRGGSNHGHRVALRVALLLHDHRHAGRLFAGPGKRSLGRVLLQRLAGIPRPEVLSEHLDQIRPSRGAVLYPRVGIPDDRRRRPAPDPLCDRPRRAFPRRSGHGFGSRLHLLRRRLRVLPGNRRRDREHLHRCHGARRLQPDHGDRRRHECRHAGNSHPTLDRDDRLRRGDRGFGRQDVHGRLHPRPHDHRDAARDDLRRRPGPKPPRPALCRSAGDLGLRPERLRRSLPDRHRAGLYLWRHRQPDRGGGRLCGLRLPDRRRGLPR